MLHLERTEPQVRSRALMWLRCQEMRPQDRDWIGDAVPRTDDADPMRMLQQLAKLTDAVHDVPLVLLIDQLEDMANQSAPVERFLKVVDAITAFTDTVPNTVVVLACLEDYFKANVEKLTKSKQDRLVRDPEPIRLLGNRTLDEIREMTARRLAHLYDTADVEVDPANELYPFRDDHLARLNNMRARDALDFLRRHHQRCITVGPMGGAGRSPHLRRLATVEMTWTHSGTTFAPRSRRPCPTARKSWPTCWPTPSGAASAELPDGFHFDCAPPDGRYLEVETHKPDNGVDKLLVAVCNANTRGVAFGKQSRTWRNAPAKSPSRSCARPTSRRRARRSTQIAGMLKRHGEKVVAADAEWRRMLAFEAFRKQHATAARLRRVAEGRPAAR